MNDADRASACADGVHRYGSAHYDRVIADLACRILDADCLNTICHCAVDELYGASHANRCHIFEFEPLEQTWLLRYGVGWPAEQLGVFRLDMRDLTGHGAEPGTSPTTAWSGDIDAHEGKVGRLFAECGGGYGLNTLIHDRHGEVFGVIGLCAREMRDCADAERDLLERIAHLLTLALRRFEVECLRRGGEVKRAGQAENAAACVDEQRKAADEARMHFILEATRIGTWDWNVQSNTVSWSDIMEELHGRSSGSFDGTLDSALADVHPEDRAALQSAISASLAGDSDYHIEYRIVTEDGRTRWLESKGQIVRDDDGRVARMAGVCMDVTDRREAEDALRISETMLRVQTEELATAHRQKDQFLAMLAHELRNPLAPISNAVQLLKIQSPEQREQTLGWAIEVIDRQVWLLSRLVDDLLDIARITRGRIELKMQHTDLRDIARIAVETAAIWFEMKNQVFEADYSIDPTPLYADPTRIIQVVTNMLNNASKFTPEYGHVGMRVFAENGQAVLKVKDSGVGISAELLPHVFEPFTQADHSLDRRKGGLGLGLSLVKRLVDMHDGSVDVVSAGRGRGSEFILRFPLANGSEPAGGDGIMANSQETLHRSRHLRVLLVDDNRQATDAMALLLETLEHTVRVAYNGPDALHVADAFRPEVVFLDIGLPLMDGYEVAEKLRARFGRGITLIALSGYAPQCGRNGRDEANFDEYLLKPLSLDKLSALLLRQTGRGPH